MKKYLLLLLLPILAYANIGKITVLTGDVSITRNGTVIKAHNGSQLEQHDFIKTEKNAKVQIVFADKTIFTIGKNSTLDIADYLYDEKEPANNKAQFNVLKGAFTSITGKIGKLNKSKFKLKTKSASIGIRGTIVKADQETVMCTQGAITVTTPNGMSVFVEAGHKTSVATGVPTTPTTIKATDEQQMGADVTEKDKQEAKQQAKTEGEAAPAPAEEAKAEDTAPAATTEDAKAEDTAPAATTTEDAPATTTKEETVSAPVAEPVTTADEAPTPAVAPIAPVATTDTNTNPNDAINEVLSTSVTQTGSSMKDGTSSANMEVQVNPYTQVVTSGGEVLKAQSADSTMSWGYWNDGTGGVDYKKVWVAGKQTDVGVLNDLRNAQKKTSLSYSGQTIGNVQMAGNSGNEAILLNSNNAVNIKVDLGGGTNNVDGNVKFQTDSTSWNSNFTGSTSGSGFSSASVTDNGAGNDVIVTGGSVNGKFYGDNAEAVGGTVQLDAAEGHKASGVFKATK